MKKYIGKRIISFLIVLVGVSILSFLLIAWSGKDPAEIIAHRGVSNPTPEQIEMIRVEMGLDQPLPVRYIQCLTKSRLEGLFTTFICPGGSQFVFTHPNYAFLSSG